MQNGGALDQKAHHIQDALEKYAVALLQHLAEDAGVASVNDSAAKMGEFHAYAEARSLTQEDFDQGRYRVYKENADRHLPVFFRRLLTHWPTATLDFEDVEAAHRNINMKGDFVIRVNGTDAHSVSYKNYRKTAATPQVCSGTFISFIMNFLFDARGVGTWVDPVTGASFRSRADQRDSALRRNGLAGIVPLMTRLDRLNESIRSRFIDGPEFEFLDEGKFDEARKQAGHEGAEICHEILAAMPSAIIRDRLVKMTGFDGAEEALIIDPSRNVDTITSEKFQLLVTGVQAAPVVFEVENQSIRFRFLRPDGGTLLSVTVPFTINKNGAWVSGTPFEGVRPYHGEPGLLAYNQRRPRKSRELATSVNTYVDLQSTGIFD